MNTGGQPDGASQGHQPMALPDCLTGARLFALCATTIVHLLVAATLASILDSRPDSTKDRGAALTVVTLATKPPVRVRKEKAEPPPATVPASSSHLPQPAKRPPIRALGAETSSAPGSSAPLPSASESVKPAKTALALASTTEHPSAAEMSSALELYRAALWRQIDAHRPRGVTMRGTAMIRFRLSPDGALIEATVSRTSGLIQLDKIALRSVRQAAPFPQAPAGIADTQLTFEIPINFR